VGGERVERRRGWRGGGEERRGEDGVQRRIGWKKIGWKGGVGG